MKTPEDPLYWDCPEVRKGIELHLDVLGGFMEEGKLPCTKAEIDLVRRLSKRVGGYDEAFYSPTSAMKYHNLTVKMMDSLGRYYGRVAKSKKPPPFKRGPS